MEAVKIISISISSEGNLLVKPTQDEEKNEDLYKYIYRMATGAFWDESNQSFSSPVPREWSYAQWFMDILNCSASELGVSLKIGPNTTWHNVTSQVKFEILNNINENT